MNDIEDRFEAAARALDQKFPDSSVPPLRLPARPQGSSTTGRTLARGWLIPLAAAAAVVAVIAGSLALAGGPGRTAPISRWSAMTGSHRAPAWDGSLAPPRWKM